MMLNDEARHLFSHLGYAVVRHLASGMEGDVYVLEGGEYVGKVWRRRTREDLRRLQSFYRHLSPQLSTLSAPEILEVSEAGSCLISIEKYLRGQPMTFDQNSLNAEPRFIDATWVCLRALRDVDCLAGVDQLAVLDEETSQGRTGVWAYDLPQLMNQRLARFGHLLQADIPDVEEIAEDCRAFIGARNGCQIGVIHGDLCGVNILSEDGSSPSAILDFGFLSMVGDLAFDAAIACAIFNMYGRHARRFDDQITQSCSRELGYSKEVLLAYRAVYCLITSNAYSSSREDGHYRWCVEMLLRPDIRWSLSSVA